MQTFRIEIQGIVQGVGFRPFVWRIANREKLVGYVRNESHGVVIVVQGQEQGIANFLRSIQSELPQSARIDKMNIMPIESDEVHSDFIIEQSVETDEPGLFPTDIAICENCLEEMFDEKDKRFLYPFINCTNCGPRFTIIQKVPYDRPNTTMSDFAMCGKCRIEYENPADRRYHAQPISCNDCGPEYSLHTSGNNKFRTGQGEVQEAAEMLRQGKIVAVHGVGGFQIMCDAKNDAAIAKLRGWKNRPSKPFAMMVENMDVAKKIAHIANLEEENLLSSSAPILLVAKRENAGISPLVAPHLSHIGIFLPYAPIHCLLFHFGAPKILIATSGNLRDEPIAKEPNDAIERLSIADAILWHNRKIHNRADDSVGYLLRNKLVLSRRARGFIPDRYRLPEGFAKRALSAGADMKGSITVSDGKYLYPSQYLGEMADPLAQDFWRETARKFLDWLQVKPELVVRDLHPDYFSSRLAQEFADINKIPLLRIQHHKAHAWAVIAEHSISEPCVAVIFDGIGLGDDLSTIWGGEFFYVNPANLQCERIGHLREIIFPGGDSATIKICRMAYAYLLQAFENDAPSIAQKLPLNNRLSPLEISIIEKAFIQNRKPITTSIGRLFDAVSAIVGVAFENEFEAFAPMRLEAIAYSANQDDSQKEYNYSVHYYNGKTVLDFSQTVREIAQDVINNRSPEKISSRFHWTVACAISQILFEQSKIYGTTNAIVSGGVFLNRLLLQMLIERLDAKLRLIFPEKNPANDQGIALGQAYWAARK